MLKKLGFASVMLNCGIGFKRGFICENLEENSII